jgi:hypothetical protein
MESLNDDETLTKPKQKKPRSEAQQEATKRMLSALDEKKLKLKVLKDKLNNAPPIPEPESEPESEEEEVVPVSKTVSKAAKPLSKSEKPVKVVSKAEKPKKEPKVIYESASESEEEVVIVKKKKKPKKKTIIYEESDESEEEEVQAPKLKTRETKTQQNRSSSFKISAPEVKTAKPAPLYYFAD